jgi:hypothetical protein
MNAPDGSQAHRGASGATRCPISMTDLLDDTRASRADVLPPTRSAIDI